MRGRILGRSGGEYDDLVRPALLARTRVWSFRKNWHRWAPVRRRAAATTPATSHADGTHNPSLRSGTRVLDASTEFVLSRAPRMRYGLDLIPVLFSIPPQDIPMTPNDGYSMWYLREDLNLRPRTGH